MRDLPERYRATVHHALIDLEPVMWMGVPLSMLRYNFFFSLGAILAIFLLQMLAFLSSLWMILCIAAVVGLAVVLHLILMWCCRADVHLMDTLITFVHYPPYLGPR